MAGLATLANERISRPWSRCSTSESCRRPAHGLPLVIRRVLARIGLTRQAGPAGPLSAAPCAYHKVTGTGTVIGVLNWPVLPRYDSYCLPSTEQVSKALRRTLAACSLLLMRCAAMRCGVGRLYGEPTEQQGRFETQEGGPGRNNGTNVACWVQGSRATCCSCSGVGRRSLTPALVLASKDSSDTNSSNRTNGYCIEYHAPAGGGCQVAPVSAARQTCDWLLLTG
jgi:hypothetical protein